jgi:hypothetical protein
VEPKRIVLRAYRVNIKGWPGDGQVYYATTAGKAKYLALLDWGDSYQDLSFADLVCRSEGVATGETSDGMRSIARCYRLPELFRGMELLVGGERGQLVEANSAHLKVFFLEGRYAGEVLSCHPRSEVRYFDRDGQELMLEEVA